MGERAILFHLWRELLGILHILPATDSTLTGLGIEPGEIECFCFS
jgi:hypothetical protein